MAGERAGVLLPPQAGGAAAVVDHGHLAGTAAGLADPRLVRLAQFDPALDLAAVVALPQVRVLVGPGVCRSRLPVSESLSRSLHATGAEILRLREPEVHPWDAAPSAQGLLF